MTKTISILQWLTVYALSNSNKRITLTAESLPVIKKTLFADWKSIVMKDIFYIGTFNKSEMVYTFPNGTVFNFVPADEPNRFHGMRQDIFFADELYNINKEIYLQADVRTNEYVISSFNPTSIFWIADHFMDENTYVDHSTYHDNPFVSESIVEALEKRIKTDDNFYRTYVLGEWGSNEGLIFKESSNWNIVKEFPEDFKWKVYGMDFGFSIDPTTLIEIGYVNGEIYVRQLIWGTGLTNPDIYQLTRDINEVIVADSAEAKSIQELSNLGLQIYPAIKGPDSIRFGINLVMQYKVNVHYESIDLIKEFRNYKWQVTRQGEQTGKPVDNWNHGIDALRYGLSFQLSGYGSSVSSPVLI